MTTLSEEARTDEARIAEVQTDEAPGDDVAPVADEPAVRTRGRRPSPLLLLASVTLVAVIALVVMSWLSLGVLTQVRDQSAVANGLQRCLIQAQLSATNNSDTTAYRAAVQACLTK